ncbi:MAG: hypothetical protein KC466_13705 [Myxococcales bacterium]|nr:hypothetical protein [Myxococcales bacterium]
MFKSLQSTIASFLVLTVIMIPTLARAGTAEDAFCGLRADALSGFQEQLAAAPDAGAARAIALGETALARGALDRASWFADEATVDRARTRLDAIDARIAAADSPAQVSFVFGTAQPLAAGALVTPYASVSGSCNYTAGEVVIIVVGLIFGIIPGLIFLWILC